MKNTVLIALIVGVITSAMILPTTLSTALAARQCDDPPCNGWGQAAKNTIEKFGGKAFGEHTSNPPDLHPEKPGREGVGNLAEELTGKKNPSDLGNAVSGSLP
jgi:hypothetical protein